jgi:peptidoglycan/LPS O-acetylase OafA/YrhL
VQRNSHIDAIDGLRAIAVLAVVLCHTPLVGAPQAWYDCGSRGVDLFFAISGFCLAYPFLRSLHATGSLDMDRGRFFRRRVIRIVPPYFAALLLFALLSSTGFGLPTAPGVHLEGPAMAREIVLAGSFLTNLPSPFNASFWTLGIEMRWYLVFPLLLALYARSRLGFFAAGAACYWLYFFTPWTFSDIGTLPCFMLGIVAADLRIRNSPVQRYAPLAAVTTLALAIWAQAHAARVDHGDPVWHAAAFCLVVAASASTVARALNARPLALAGIASYSIYLVHEPVLNSLWALHLNAFVCAAGAVACGFVFYRVVERPCLDKRFRQPAEALLARVFTLHAVRAAFTRTATHEG